MATGLSTLLTLLPGTRLDPYVIVAAIGRGGMGEVYRARDPRLDRHVAIKVLREHLAGDAIRRSRLDREARLISQLNHPHICTLYDVGEHEGAMYLVFELLDGETLAERLDRGHRQPLPLKETLSIAIGVADALEAAHRRGIVHRDLKPSNVMLTRTVAKLLDFGIAKATRPAGIDPNGTHVEPRATLTLDGTLLGTLHYMAPEQIEGDGDERSDIFAFGAVLYEMLTGRRAFDGDSQSKVLAAVLDDNPPSVDTIRPNVPAALGHLVKTCLAKGPDDRWQNAGDVKRQLEWIAANVADPPVEQPHLGRGQSVLQWFASAAIVAVVALAATLWWSRSKSAEMPEMRLQIATTPTDFDNFALSPDGQRIIFRAVEKGQNQLWLRSLDAEKARPLDSTTNGVGPFWSPDGESIGFFADGKLKRLDLSSGLIRTLADSPNPFLATWSRTGTILFAPTTSGAIYSVPASGGAVRQVTELHRPRETAHWAPHFLPDSQHFLFFAWGPIESKGVYAGSLNSTETRRLFDADAPNLAFVPPDYVMFAREGALLAQRLNLTTIEPAGPPVVVNTRVAITGGHVPLSASSTGSIAYRTDREEYQFVWFDRSGREVGALGDPDRVPRNSVSLSPDGHKAAFGRRIDGNFNIWMIDASGLQRLTFDNRGNKFKAIWSSDGSRLLFNWDPNGVLDLYEKPLIGNGNATLLWSSPEHKFPEDWSSDGSFVLYSIDDQTGSDLWALPVRGHGNPIPVAQTQFDELNGRFSPDGRFVAYQSDESGRFEIYIQSFPDRGTRSKISIDGGTSPQWRQDGRELYYVSADNHLMAVSLSLNGSGTTPGKAEPLFLMPETPTTQEFRPTQRYAAARDGQRFLAYKVTADPPPITLLLNWKLLNHR